jgi:hypothetical protein
VVEAVEVVKAVPRGRALSGALGEALGGALGGALGM